MSWMTDWERDRSDREDEIAARMTPPENIGVERVYSVEECREMVTTFTEKIGKFRQALKDQHIHVGIGIPPICATCDTPWPCEEASK